MKYIGDYKIPTHFKNKTIRGRASEVYRLNKGRIDEALAGIEDKQKAFIRSVSDRMEQGVPTLKEAITNEFRSEVYIDPEKRILHDIVDKLKEQGDYDKLLKGWRERDERGRWIKTDKKKPKIYYTKKGSSVYQIGDYFIDIDTYHNAGKVLLIPKKDYKTATNYIEENPRIRKEY